MILAFRTWLHPPVEASSVELKAREFEAAAAAEREFQELRKTRQLLDRRSHVDVSSLDSISVKLNKADKIMREAIGDG